MNYRTFFIITLSFFALASCSLLGERSPNAEYSLYTSVPGANVYRSDGKIIGQTPLVLGWTDVEDVIDGRFVSFIVEKSGYFTRVVFFDATDSVNLKIDLAVDKEYLAKRKELVMMEIETVREKNDNLLAQKVLMSEAIASYKKNEEMYLKNMEVLTGRLKESDLQLAQMKDESFNRSIASAKVNVDVATKSVQPEVLAEIVPVTPNKKEVEVDTPRPQDKKVVKESSKSTVTKVVYYPTPQTNALIRELLTVQFLIINNDYKSARDLILRMEQKNPKVAALYTLLAYIETKEGRIPKAQGYLKKSLMIDGKDDMAKRLLEVISSAPSVKRG